VSKDAATLEPGSAPHVVRVQLLAAQTFGDAEQADRWLRHPLAELGNEAPFAVAQTEAGARVVATLLGKITWGAAA
jgi:putative toxin-antitoxin system antitoxin component (TIGR02293 family)